MKAIAVIPCYNEEQHISDLIFLSNQFVNMSIVSDDNSKDKTVEKAREAGAYVIRNFGRRGYGSNSQSGIREAIMQGCDVVVTLDGDGQHDPKEIPQLVKPIIDGKSDVVVGTRFARGHKTAIGRFRKVGIKFITWLYNIGNDNKLSDVQCGFRAFSKKAIEALRITESGMAFSVETIIKLRHLGYPISEVPVTVLYPKQYSKHTNLLKQGFYVITATLRWRFLLEVCGRKS